MSKKRKKYGGIIKDWQVHTLSFSEDDLNKVYPGEQLKPLVITGTVVKDELGRWLPGDHMRTSLVKVLDREKGKVETRNTIYRLEGKENADVVPDLGNGVLGLFY